MTEKARMMKDTLIYSAANYISQIIGVFNSILMRRFLGPASMGVWGIFQVVLDYAGQASLGTTRAMAREYPFYRGKGDDAKADSIKDTTVSFTMLMSIIPFVAILVYLTLKWSTLEAQFRYCMVFVLGFLFLQRFYDFIITLLRSDKKFKKLSLVIIFNAVLGILATLTAVRHHGIYGLLWSTAGVMVLMTIFCMKRDGYSFRFRIDRQVLLSELKLALPLAAGAFLLTFLRGLDKIIIAKQLGFYEVGIYSIAMMVANYILSVPMMFSQVWFPNLQQAFGRNNGDLQAVKHYLEKPLLGLAVLLPGLCAASFVLMPLLIQFYLQEFAEGIPVMRLYLLSLFFLMLGQFSFNFLVTAGRYWSIVPVLGFAILLNYLLANYLVKNNWGLQGVAFATVASYAFYGVGCLMLAMKQAMNLKERQKILIKSVMIYLILFFFVFTIDSFFESFGLWRGALLKSASYFLLFLPPAYWLDKETKVFSDFLKLITDLIRRNKPKVLP